jgi:hypothetical protein
VKLIRETYYTSYARLNAGIWFLSGCIAGLIAYAGWM